MSEYLFGLGPGHVSAKIRRIAKAHGATAVNYTEPDGRERHWFAGPNRGEPFNRMLEAEVMAAVTIAQSAALGYEVVKASPYEVGLIHNGRGVRTWWASEFGGKLPPLTHPEIQQAINTNETLYAKDPSKD